MTNQLIPMSVKEFVEKLLKGERNLSGINLLEEDLSGCRGFDDLNKYLRGQKIMEIIKNPVNITGSNFSYVKAIRLYLPDVKGERANFEGAYLERANFEGANFEGANFNGADLTGADLTGAYLVFADLKRAKLVHANFWGANLNRADLERADLTGAGLGRANLIGAYLNGADLTGADLIGAYLERANLNGANLNGADLTGADLNEAYLFGTNLKGVKNLETVRGLDNAYFLETRVTDTERKVIEKALERKNSFVVERY